MALWKLTVKRSGVINGVRLEKGMSIEMTTMSSSNPLTCNLSQNAPQINRLFENKYGVDLMKGHLVTSNYLESERIS